MIRRAAALPEPEPEELPRDAIRLPGGAGNTTRGEGVRRGVGFAVGFKNLCYSEGFDDFCAARVRLFADGAAEVHCAAAEVGQGVDERDPPGRAHGARHGPTCTLAPGSTAAVASSGSASASRMTWMAAGAVRDACRAALAERERHGGGEVDVERDLPPPADERRSTRRPGQVDGRARARRLRVSRRCRPSSRSTSSSG